MTLHECLHTWVHKWGLNIHLVAGIFHVPVETVRKWMGEEEEEQKRDANSTD